MNKKHQKNKITLIITAISAILMASLYTVGSQLTNNALAQTITNQSDAAIIETQSANISNMENKIKTPITEINNTEIGRATPTTDSINKIK
jgi:Na+-translocating ferredoxin:NAD+ oxidoreductase RnfG subunit